MKKQPTKKTPAPQQQLARQQSKPLTPKIQDKALARKIDAEQDAGAGQESMDRKDFMIPRLSILQSGSPQVKKAEQDKYIKGAEEGMICDVLNSRIFSGEQGVLVIPCSYRRTNIEWKPNRGGFVADHGADDKLLETCTKDPEKGAMVLPNKNILQVTAEYFVLVVNPDGTTAPFVLSMSGSQLKKSRRWNTMINQLRVPKADGTGTFNPAMFYRAYRLQTVPESNDKGAWFSWQIVSEEDVLKLRGGEEIYLAARALRQSVATGEVKATAPSEAHMGSGPSDESADTPM